MGTFQFKDRHLVAGYWPTNFHTFFYLKIMEIKVP